MPRYLNVQSVCKTIFYIYVGGIFLSPRLVANRIRLEDILFPLLILLGFPLIFKYSKKIATVFLYYFFVFFVSILGILKQEVSFLGLLIYLKEFQYLFLALFLFEYRNRGGTFESIKKPIQIIIGIASLFSFVSVLLGNISYYGISAINETSPSLSAWTFVGETIILYIICRETKFTKIDYGLFLMLALSLIFVGSRTGIVLFGLFFCYVLFQNYKKSIPLGILFGAVFFAISPLLFADFDLDKELNNDQSLFRAVNRYSTLLTVNESLNPREKSWKKRSTKDFTLIEKLIGKGRGFSNMEWEYHKRGQWRSFAMVVDSQYVRNLQEIGWIGSILFILMMLSFYMIIPSKYWFLYSTILMMYFLSFYTMESFLISKPGGLYWILVGLLVRINPVMGVPKLIK